MGLIKAAAKAAGSTLADQWLELFVADSLDGDTLMVKGTVQAGKGSSNTRRNDNVISNGSGLLVNDGQCAIIVDQGIVVELCAEPGYYTYDQSTEPSIFAGNFGESLKEVFNTAVKRFKYGGDAAKDQRVYYFNTKEIMDNKFGTPNPIPYRVVDAAINFDMEVNLRVAGVYSLHICDPITLYKNVIGNVATEFHYSEIADQMKAEFIGALQPAVSVLAEQGLRPSQLTAHIEELCNAMNDALAAKWKEKRGLEAASITLNSVTLTDEDKKRLQDAQEAKQNMTPELRAAQQAAASAASMRAAASNESGAAMGFMGMGMANNAGVSNQAVYEAAIAANQQAAAQQAAQQAAQVVNTPTAQAVGGWTCTCGTVNTGKFCSNCGTKKPEGAVCPKCGSPLVAGAKFCPECGEKLQ